MLKPWRRFLKQHPKNLSHQLENAWQIEPAVAQSIVRLAGDRKASVLKKVIGQSVCFASQYGEDILLGELFQYKRQGFFIELGAYDGIFLSNTFFFEQLGWEGVLVEPLPARFAECLQNRPRSKVIHAAIGKDASGTISITEVIGKFPQTGETLGPHSFVKSVPAHRQKWDDLEVKFVTHTVPYCSFDSIAQEALIQPGKPIDLLSIDCEGMDYEILTSINLQQWQPHIVIVEAKSLELFKYLNQHGYSALLHTMNNTIFSRAFEDRAVLSRQGYWRALGFL